MYGCKVGAHLSSAVCPSPCFYPILYADQGLDPQSCISLTLSAGMCRPRGHTHPCPQAGGQKVRPPQGLCENGRGVGWWLRLKTLERDHLGLSPGFMTSQLCVSATVSRVTWEEKVQQQSPAPRWR